MIKQMKIVILAIACLQISSMLTASKVRVEAATSRAESQGVFYTVSDPVYYSYTPLYYTYTPSTFYYYSYTYDPYVTVSYPTTYTYTTYPSYWRKGGESSENKENKEPKVDEMQKEVSNLKKEVWGKEDFSSEQIRKESKAYDSRWLIAQLKITRILELEDVILQKKNEGLKSRTSDENNADAEQSFRIEDPKDTKPAPLTNLDEDKYKLPAPEENTPKSPNAKVSTPAKKDKKTDQKTDKKTDQKTDQKKDQKKEKPKSTPQNREEEDSAVESNRVDDTTNNVTPAKSSTDEKRPHPHPSKPKPKQDKRDADEDCADQECLKPADKSKKEENKAKSKASPATSTLTSDKTNRGKVTPTTATAIVSAPASLQKGTDYKFLF